MGSPIGVHPDGSNCYTVNCSLQGHSPMGISKEDFIAVLQNENAKDKWNKTQNIFKTLSMKYLKKSVTSHDGRWRWSEEQKDKFFEDYQKEMKRIEDERFVTNGRQFNEDDLPHYARLVAFEAEQTVANRPEWKKIAEDAYTADKERREEWFSKEDITKAPEYKEYFDKYMRASVHYADWKKENIKKDLEHFIKQTEEARYRRSTGWKEPAYMSVELNANVFQKNNRRKRYIELLFDEAYVNALNMKDARDIANGDEIVRSSHTIGVGIGTTAMAVNIVS